MWSPKRDAARAGANRADGWKRPGWTVLTLLLIAIVAYLALWRVTEVYGTRSVREMVTVLADDRSHLRICDARFGDRGYRNPIPLKKGLLHVYDHYCRARALAPFMVELSSGYHCGPLCGAGSTAWLFWAPGGIRIPLRVTFNWQS